MFVRRRLTLGLEEIYWGTKPTLERLLCSYLVADWVLFRTHVWIQTQRAVQFKIHINDPPRVRWISAIVGVICCSSAPVSRLFRTSLSLLRKRSRVEPFFLGGVLQAIFAPERKRMAYTVSLWGLPVGLGRDAEEELKMCSSVGVWLWEDPDDASDNICCGGRPSCPKKEKFHIYCKGKHVSFLYMLFWCYSAIFSRLAL